MENKNEEIIAKYNKISDEIYTKLNELKELIESEGFEDAVNCDQEEHDGDNCLVGCFEAYIENLSESYR
jgi:hypothetical protein